jgi:adenylate cyclase class IV
MKSELEHEIKLTLVNGNSSEIMDKALTVPFIYGGSVFISEHYTDYYYDTPEGDFYSTSGSLRVREFSDGKRRITLKSFVSDKDGILTRNESEGLIVESNEEAVLRVVKSTFPEFDGEVNHVITLETHRWMMSTASYTVCVDNCRYLDPSDNSEIQSFVELEIESMREAINYSDEVRNFVSVMESTFGMAAVTDSKYKRGYNVIEELKSR